MENCKQADLYYDDLERSCKAPQWHQVGISQHKRLQMAAVRLKKGWPAPMRVLLRAKQDLNGIKWAAPDIVVGHQLPRNQCRQPR